MPLAVLSGLGHPRLTEVFRAVDPKDVVLVGVRSLDPGEKRLLKEAGVRVYTMHEVDRLGVAKASIGFVSSNCWDALGAKSFGFRVYWINRLKAPVDRLGFQPDKIVAGLNEVLL